jgi:hypothetical protein
MRGTLYLHTGKFSWENGWRTDKGNISPKKVQPLIDWLEDQGIENLEEVQEIFEAAEEVIYEHGEAPYMPDDTRLRTAIDNLVQVAGW